MASYTLFWANDTWEKYSKGRHILDYVAGANKRPLTDICPDDEIFVVTLIRGNLYIAGRLVVATKPLNRREAVEWLGRDDLFDRPLYFVANRGDADVFRSGCLVELEIAKKLELIRVDKSISHPALDKKSGFIERNAFRTSALLTVKSADILRSILAQSTVPLRPIGTVTDKVATIQPAQKIDRLRGGVGKSQSGDDADPGEHCLDVDCQFDEVVKDINRQCVNLVGADVDAIVKRRVGQGVFRDRLLDEFEGSCCITSLKNNRLLIASHIIPWSESDASQKLDPNNGLLLSVAIDALFDKGLISFAESGEMLFSSELDPETIEILGLERETFLPAKLLNDVRKLNLAKHRMRHGFQPAP